MPELDPGEVSARTVVVADDDAGMRLLIKSALEQDAWRVVEAEDGEQACDAVDRCQPAIVVLDVGMPNLDGFAACERLRAHPSNEDLAILMLTVKDDQESISRAYEVGATDFLSKPCNFTVLRQRLRYMHRAERNGRALRHERDFASTVIEHSAALVLVLDATGRILRFNGCCEAASGLTLEACQGKHLWDVLSSPEDRNRERDVFERMTAERGTSSYEGVWTRQDGSRREIAWSNSVLLNSGGEVEHVVYTGLDVTDRNEAEKQLKSLASYDALTKLPNRRFFSERIEQALAATGDEHVAVLILDVDRFKEMQAMYGYAAGDRLLTDLTDRLSMSLRVGNLVAGRNASLRTELGHLGGGEFCVLITGARDIKEIASINERLQQATKRPFKVQDEELVITTSLGIALYPGDGSESATILRNAHSAMQAARERMRGTYRFYSKAMHASVSNRMSLESELRQAVDRGEFILQYQDKVLTRSGAISGAEALLRWQHPTRGLLSPGSFIELAEETGLIVPIGEWVMRRACNQVMNWIEAGLPAVPVAVNLSALQFNAADLLRFIASILTETSIDPSYLAFEITESTIMRDQKGARDVLGRLQALGMKVAIDDFGSGYSALASLKDLPVQQLKIDHSFIRNLASDPKDVVLVRSMITMAHGLGLSVIAEGVETKEQLAILREEQCDEVQGVRAIRPVSSDEFASLLQPSPAHPAA